MIVKGYREHHYAMCTQTQWSWLSQLKHLTRADGSNVECAKSQPLPLLSNKLENGNNKCPFKTPTMRSSLLRIQYNEEKAVKVANCLVLVQ